MEDDKMKEDKEVFSLRDIPNDLVEIMLENLDREDQIKLLNLAKMRKEKDSLIHKIRKEHSIEFKNEDKSLFYVNVAKETREDYIDEFTNLDISVDKFGIYEIMGDNTEEKVYSFNSDYKTYFVHFKEDYLNNLKQTRKANIIFIFYLNKFELILNFWKDSLSFDVLSSKIFNNFIKSFDLYSGLLTLENGDIYSIYFNDIEKKFTNINFAKCVKKNDKGMMFVDNGKIERIYLNDKNVNLNDFLHNQVFEPYQSIYRAFNKKPIDDKIDYINLFSQIWNYIYELPEDYHVFGGYILDLISVLI